jgi:hypothetical protein
MRSALTFVFALAMVSPVAAQAEAQALVKKAIQAHGGTDKLSKAKTGMIELSGTINIQGIDAPFKGKATYALPTSAKNEIELTVQGQKLTVVQIIHDGKATMTVNGQNPMLPDAQREELVESLYVQELTQLVTLLEKKDFVLATTKEVMVEGKPALGVKVSSKGHKDATLYFDKESNRLVKLERKTVTDEGKEANEEQFYSDFKEFDGLTIPTKEVTLRDGKKVSESKITAHKLVDKIDPKEFKQGD